MADSGSGRRIFGRFPRIAAVRVVPSKSEFPQSPIALPEGPNEFH